MEAVFLLVLVPLAVLAGALLWREQGREDEQNLLRYRQAADAQFRTLVVPSDDPRMHFNGMQVEEVMDEESLRYVNERLAGIELTRYARNEAGEYFMFVHNPEGKPFFKHVEHRIAKVVLKERYQAPPASLAEA